MALNAIPSGIIFLGCVFFINESPRFLITKGKFDIGIEVIDKMIK